MHELSIAQSVLDSVREQAALHSGRRVRRVGIKVGETSGVNAEALEFCFGLTVQDTELAGVTLDVERVPVRFRCEGCGDEFTPVEFDPQCPSCGSGRGRMVGGDELALSFLELEETS